jgi:hypothetical protein
VTYRRPIAVVATASTSGIATIIAADGSHIIGA